MQSLFQFLALYLLPIFVKTLYFSSTKGVKVFLNGKLLSGKKKLSENRYLDDSVFCTIKFSFESKDYISMIRPILTSCNHCAAAVQAKVFGLEFISNDYSLTGEEYSGSIDKGKITVRRKTIREGINRI